MASSKEYQTNCVDCGDGRSINDMVSNSKKITKETFLKHVRSKELKSIEIALGYFSHHKQGLTMAQDFCVKYHKSRFRGIPCVYFTWSRIEYIFT